MKKLILLLVILAGGYIARQTFCNSKAGMFFQEQVKISELKTKQSVFADSLVTLHDVKIECCESVFNYSRAIISDVSGDSIMLISKTPFKKDEITDVTGRMVVVYQHENRSCLIFLDSRLKPMNDLLNLVKGSMGL